MTCFLDKIWILGLHFFYDGGNIPTVYWVCFVWIGFYLSRAPSMAAATLVIAATVVRAK